MSLSKGTPPPPALEDFSWALAGDFWKSLAKGDLRDPVPPYKENIVSGAWQDTALSTSSQRANSAGPTPSE